MSAQFFFDVVVFIMLFIILLTINHFLIELTVTVFYLIRRMYRHVKMIMSNKK